jgi:aminopeptidase N
VVGAETFIEIMSTYYEENALQVATIEDFIEIVRDVGGEEAVQILTRGR